ncbi:MAG: ABC transporter permease [Anaerolineae bacterium]|jgi:hypothetical protein
MARFRVLLSNEIKLFRTAIPIHLVVILQPTVMYLLMAVILVHPTFDMSVARPDTGLGWALVAAMEEVRSPVGPRYIQPILVERQGSDISRQVVVVEDRDGVATAVQHYGLIDSNLVKNLRNRLTAAALRLWDADLGQRAVVVDERPWLPRDVPYSVYFGMGLQTMAAFLAAAAIGAILTAQEFELGTILEYRLAPAPVALILGARLTRLVLTALIAAAFLLVAVGLVTGYWPRPLWRVVPILFLVGVIAGCMGVLAGLLLRKTIPAFLVGLVGGFVGWILGSGFGLAAGFGIWYQRVSRLTPLTHATELLFPSYYGQSVGSPLASLLFLVLLSGGLVVLTVWVYRQRVTRQA